MSARPQERTLAVDLLEVEVDPHPAATRHAYAEGFAAGSQRAGALILQARRDAVRETTDALVKAILDAAAALRGGGL